MKRILSIFCKDYKLSYNYIKVYILSSSIIFEIGLV